MLKDKIKTHSEALKRLIPERNEIIVQEAVLGKTSYAELGRKYGLTKQRIRQILDKYHVKFTSKTDSPKHTEALKRQSETMKQVIADKRSEEKPKLEDIMSEI